MKGRKAKPVQLHIHDNVSKKTKAEIEARLAQEAGMRFGGHDFVAPSEIKSDKIALKKWNEIVDLYISAQIDFVTTADTGILMQYCLTYSEYINLINTRKKIMKDNKKDVVAGYGLLESSKIEHNINKKNELLSKLGKILYLDPQSRLGTMKNINTKKEPSELEKQGFGNI